MTPHYVHNKRMWVRGLYAYPAVPGRVTIPAPDLAAGPPRVSNGGTTYRITIRSGARWDTSPFSPVTGADAVLGLKRSCNPAQPFGGLPDFLGLIKGMAAFCAGFAKVAKTVPAIRSYIDTHTISGVAASGQAITFTLTRPASYFADMLSLSPFNPAPPQSLNWVPGSAAAQRRARPAVEARNRPLVSGGGAFMRSPVRLPSCEWLTSLLSRQVRTLIFASERHRLPGAVVHGRRARVLAAGSGGRADIRGLAGVRGGWPAPEWRAGPPGRPAG